MIYGIIAILIVLLVLIVYTELRKWRMRKKLGYFVVARALPIIGFCGRFLGKSNDEIVETILQMYDEVDSSPVQAWAGPILVVGIREPQDIRIILTAEHALNKPYFYNFIPCKSSLICAHKEMWKVDRRALNSAFNVKMLQNYMPLLNEKAGILLEQMEEHLSEPGNLYRTILIGMMDMISRTTMGSEMHLQTTDRGGRLYDVAKQIMNNIQHRTVRIWLKWDFVYALTKRARDGRVPLQVGFDFIEEMYLKKINEFDAMKESGIDYLQSANEQNATNLLDKCILLEQMGVFNNQKVLDEMRVIFLAGIDTSAIVIFSTLFMLAINQRHQELVVRELLSICGAADCDLTQSHLIGMNYLERVIKETMRLLTPVPFFARQTTADIPLSKGTIPTNTFVFISIMHMHRDPKIWGENVLEFDPDRFLPDNVKKRPPYSYIPFSAGPRNCIGMKYAMISVKITLAHLLRRFKFSTDLHFNDIRTKLHLVLEITNEKPLRMERRLDAGLK